MARRSSIETLPLDVRRWLERALADRQHPGYMQLEGVLRDQGYEISKSAIHRYDQNIQRRMGAIKASTEAARLITEAARDDQDARSEAVIALVQTELFESIMKLQDASDEDLPNEARIDLLSSAAKNIATLSRASVNQKKFRLDEEARIEREARARLLAEQEVRLSTQVKAAGLSDEAAAMIRQKILGVAG